MMLEKNKEKIAALDWFYKNLYDAEMLFFKTFSFLIFDENVVQSDKNSLFWPLLWNQHVCVFHFDKKKCPPKKRKKLQKIYYQIFDLFRKCFETFLVLSHMLLSRKKKLLTRMPLLFHFGGRWNDFKKTKMDKTVIRCLSLFINAPPSERGCAPVTVLEFFLSLNDEEKKASKNCWYIYDQLLLSKENVWSFG